MSNKCNWLYEAIKAAVEAEISQVKHASPMSAVRVERAWADLYDECNTLLRKIDDASDPHHQYA
jgi:hypothetical protein